VLISAKYEMNKWNGKNSAFNEIACEIQSERSDMAKEKWLLVFFGMIASGKSYLAMACAKKWNCAYHNSDIVRKQLAGLPSTGREHSGYEAGIYSSEFSRRTYDTLIDLARQDLAREKNACVILDASFKLRRERQQICLEFGSEFQILFIHCQCKETVLKKRMAKRLKDPQSVSDGRWEIYLKQKERFELPVELPAKLLLTLDTDRPLAELVSLLENKIGV
jgi:predicted kinase